MSFSCTYPYALCLFVPLVPHHTPIVTPSVCFLITHSFSCICPYALCFLSSFHATIPTPSACLIFNFSCHLHLSLLPLFPTLLSCNHPYALYLILVSFL